MKKNLELEKEYNHKFNKFYNDFFQYQSGSKRTMYCEGCSEKKKFIFNENELIYSCGPNKKDKKCGIQFKIKLPKYINFNEFKEKYDSMINGSSEYLPNNIKNYDLNQLSKTMNLTKELELQTNTIQEGSNSLKDLIKDFNTINNLSEIKQNLKDLSKQRLKLSVNKKHIMNQLINDDNTEEEKQKLRKKYAILIKESYELIPLINKLKEKNNIYLMISEPNIINNFTDKKHYTYDEQIKILISFYKKVDPDKSETDIYKIIDNRRNKGTPKGTEIPHKPWLNLCEKLHNKYKINPLD
tara:strand:+ start:611 stop:1504 length:894 start_codon:yes stop_codon:yes gene_type:complete